jgi:hypothetical protein
MSAAPRPSRRTTSRDSLFNWRATSEISRLAWNDNDQLHLTGMVRHNVRIPNVSPQLPEPDSKGSPSFE